ncbi:hypothetical protein IFM51744_10603 [Aspergillus udagawae]|uniref:ubiquitinyl hydrolase 1 n=1 Tax=Aspergillus udagawae TaxID=91492 RepID=A0ABQ1BEV3_9EURO|nr:hypothetical protein IFM51744_10603 [Aspergillus udagawae]GFG00331.1 hypothetical protein IFM53868_10718 [Aspergillus udagawae]
MDDKDVHSGARQATHAQAGDKPATENTADGFGICLDYHAHDEHGYRQDSRRATAYRVGEVSILIRFKQTIGHACGSIGLLHSLINSPAVDFIKRDSDLAVIRSLAMSLDMTKRAEMLYNSESFELAHKSVEQAGDSYADPTSERNGGHFPQALDMGIKRIIKLNADGGGESLLFSCIALARRPWALTGIGTL